MADFNIVSGFYVSNNRFSSLPKTLTVIKLYPEKYASLLTQHNFCLEYN